MKTRSRPENEKPGNEKLNSRFTLKSPMAFADKTKGVNIQDIVDVLDRTITENALDDPQHVLGPVSMI